MDEADRCSDVAILYEGKIVIQGKPEDLKAALPFEVVEVKSKPRKAAREAAQEVPYLVDWRPVGDRLRIAVERGKSSRVIKTLEEKLDNEDTEVRILRKAAPLMEDVFTYEVKMSKN